MVEEGQNQPESPLKRIRSEEIRENEDEDRISRLPDCLLVEILSRLPDTKCAVKTSALSKRWKCIWSSVPILDFTHHGRNPSPEFISFVDKVLSQRGQLKLKKLGVYTTYNDRFEPHVRNWIHYAINCNVEKINMYFSNRERLDPFLLDRRFLTSSDFKDLRLTACKFNPAEAISWKNLSRLSLCHLELGEDLLENILSGSPLLETLELEECYGYSRLNITSKNLKKLVFDGYLYGRDVIEINAPNILTLKIQSYLYMGKLLLTNMSSLVEADLNYKLSSDLERISKESEEQMLKCIILNLGHVKELKIGSFCFKVLCRLVEKGFIFPSNLKVSDDCCYPFQSDDDSDVSDSDESGNLDGGHLGDDD